MGSKRPQNGRTGKKKGDKDTKEQRSMLEFTVKKPGDAIQKTTAKKTSISGSPIPSQPSSKGSHVADDGGHVADDGGQAIQDQTRDLWRRQLAHVNKPRDKASQDDFDESKLQVCHQKNDKQY